MTRDTRKPPRRMAAGIAPLLPPVVMPTWQVIHEVRPMPGRPALGREMEWECLATCGFVGSRTDALAHAVHNQFDLVPR